MVTEGIALDIFIDFFFGSFYQMVVTGALRYFSLLPYFRNFEIKNTDLTHCFWSLRSVLTKLLLVRTHTQLMTYFWIGGIEE